METAVRNLTSFEILLREKIYGDIPRHSVHRKTISFNRASSSVIKMQEEILNFPQEEASRKCSKEEYEHMYNKYTVSEYSVIKTQAKYRNMKQFKQILEELKQIL